MPGFFFFNDTATTEIYTLSLHDALPISVTDTEARIRVPIQLAEVINERGHRVGVHGHDQKSGGEGKSADLGAGGVIKKKQPTRRHRVSTNMAGRPRRGRKGQRPSQRARPVTSNK